jgi:hypothetical protein
MDIPRNVSEAVLAVKSAAMAIVAHTEFPQFDTPTLRHEIETLNGKIQAIQRSKDHHKKRDTLSLLQSTIHKMRLELKRRDELERRAKANV